MLDSVNYINSRLETYYNTEPERIDIQRNKEYLEIMLAKPSIIDNIKPEQLLLVQHAIDRAASVLLNNAQ